MRKQFFLLTIFSFLFVYAVHAQEESTVLLLNQDKHYYYEHVYEMPGKSKAELFAAIKTWVIKNVKDQSANYFDEAEKNTITTTIAFVTAFNSSVEFKLNIDLKEGKYKLSAGSFIWHNMQGISRSLGDYKGIGRAGKVEESVLADVDENFRKTKAAIKKSVTADGAW